MGGRSCDDPVRCRPHRVGIHAGEPLLTPIAADLHLTEGQAGQPISLSGIFAVLTSPSIAAATGRLDRRIVLLSLTLLVIVSGTIVAFAPNFLVLMIGRALLGVAIGGF